nr:hypothetical protein Iba_chr12fCG13100 [Ipomoea batatas]
MERAEISIEANDRNLEEDRIANLRAGEISGDNMRVKCQEINKILKAEQVKVQVEEDETESSRRDGKDPVMPEDKNREDAGKERLKEVKFVETPKENTDGAFAETPFGPSRKVEGTNVVRGVMKPIEERDFVGNIRSNGASVSGTKPSDDGYSDREKVWKTGENRKETDCPTGVCENVKETIQKPVNMNKGARPATSKGPGQSKKENLPNTTETGRRNKQENVGDAQRGQQHDNIGVKGGKTGKSEGAEEVVSGENESNKEKVSEEDQEFKYGYAKSAKEADKKKKSIDGEEEKRQGIERMVFESDEKEMLQGIKQMVGRGVRVVECARKVNCLAEALTYRFGRRNVVFSNNDGLPKEIRWILALEGIPHFSLQNRSSRLCWGSDRQQMDKLQQLEDAVCISCSNWQRRLWDPGGCSMGIKLSMKGISMTKDCRSMKNGAITPLWAEWLSALSEIVRIETDCLDRPDFGLANARILLDRLISNFRDLEAGEDHRRPTVRFAEAEWRRMAEIDERCTLVARFVKERPPLELIRARIGEVVSLEGGSCSGVAVIGMRI